MVGVVVGVVRVGRRVSAGETSGAQLLPTDTHLARIILTLSHVRQYFLKFISYETIIGDIHLMLDKNFKHFIFCDTLSYVTLYIM